MPIPSRRLPKPVGGSKIGNQNGIRISGNKTVNVIGNNRKILDRQDNPSLGVVDDAGYRENRYPDCPD
jgi:hypothetical protein